MNLSLRLRSRVSKGSLEAFESLSGAGRRVVLGAMAKELAVITRRNFGPKGINRPSRWAALSKKYGRWKARHVGNANADLILSGKLLGSVRSECNNDNFAEMHVGEGVDYAAAHQFGLGRMPRRPFIPMKSATRATPYVETRLKMVAEREIARLLNK